MPIMSNSSHQPCLRFRLILGRSIAFGPGKADLLTAIAETGSISAAGRSMGMSYKKAWYPIDTMNRCFREPLVVASKGGSSRGGAHLTAMGEKVLELYRSIENQASEAAARDLDAFSDLIVDGPPKAEFSGRTDLAGWADIRYGRMSISKRRCA